MYAHLEQRLQQLKAEFDAGQQMLAELEEKQQHLRTTLLRISGATQVLEEQLGKVEQEAVNGVTPLVGATRGDG